MQDEITKKQIVHLSAFYNIWTIQMGLQRFANSSQTFAPSLQEQLGVRLIYSVILLYSLNYGGSIQLLV